ncbi:MAG: hypothetical protein M1556_01215 [Candidatus Thermoplasmatota archaeon]|jgi:hypothetical protein|nr:hypothetical protein [Candidatus Thermoplasmatota archaeon]MCL6002254.1 hypothetical protein [Candidatus Thermoplasmatota archaeon]
MKGIYSVINFVDDPVSNKGKPIGVIILTSKPTARVKVRRKVGGKKKIESKLILSAARSIARDVKRESNEKGFNGAHKKLLTLDHDLKNSIQLGSIKELKIKDENAFEKKLIREFDTNILA